MQSSRLFTEERDVVLDPLKAHRWRVMKDREEFEPMTRASEILLTAEEPSIRTYFCAKNVVMEFIRNHPNDPRGYKELGKVHLYSCVPENIDLAEEAFQRVQSLSGHIDAEGWYLISMCHRIRLFGSDRSSSSGPSAAGKPGAPVDRHQRLAERCLQRALAHSHGSSVYRFALSEFYATTGRLSKALAVLQAGLSPRGPPTRADAAIFHQLARLGIAASTPLQARARPDRALLLARAALLHYRHAIAAADPRSARAWARELASAEAFVARLAEETADIAAFAAAPSGPVSLRSRQSASPAPPSASPPPKHPRTRPTRSHASRASAASFRAGPADDAPGAPAPSCTCST
ncbi:hypothetical protein PtA15_13A246 [Puccinia triticina]|uniref:RAVE complex protein Rav1 C-terminal domain-containing protein n=1 Tax=Puccinia triticina TaxID=208348 RepID=A0ABY7D2D7_9BASI|nr:uncharacterized protein PtA15_13A246 [Puccinia triticina]WAQ90847.1 hypothetical protein PtA15_13A246 [Puccinia triticina]